MSKSLKASTRTENGIVEVKSKLDAEFRRFALDKGKTTKCEEFFQLLELLHGIKDFIVCYTDPKDGDLLPINNDDNFQRAVYIAKPLLRIMIQRKGETTDFENGYGTLTKKKTVISKLIAGEPRQKPHISIGLPEDFRRVSAIIDVDVIPETHRRVKLMKNGSDKPLGFYIRDGTSVRVTSHGLEKVPGIFISRLVPGGLAEGTGLLAVNDEVLEVNGIEVSGKTLDQVTDMMVANSSNLIITVKPVNQRNNIGPRGGSGRVSQKSTTSLQSGYSMNSGRSFDSDTMHDSREDEEDEVRDHLKEETVATEIEKVEQVAEKVEKEAEKADAEKEDKDSAVVTL